MIHAIVVDTSFMVVEGDFFTVKTEAEFELYFCQK